MYTETLDEGLTRTKQLSHLGENAARHERWAFLTEGRRKDANGNVVQKGRSRFDKPWAANEHGVGDVWRRKLEIMYDAMADWTFGDEAQECGNRVTPMTEGVLSYLRGDSKKLVTENAVTTASISTFTTTAFPLIRRVYPNLVSNFLVAIQPIPLPTTMLFYLDFKYGTSFAPAARGDYVQDRTVVSSQTKMMRARQYASGVITGEAVGTGDGTTTVFYLAYFPVISASVTVTDNGSPTTPTIDTETGKLTFGSAPTSGHALVANYSLVFEGTGPIPSVELVMSSDSVTVESKKIKFSYSIESQQDAAAYHGLDIDSELLNLSAEELTRETDSLIINDLVTAATGSNTNSRTDTGAGNGGAGNVNWSQTVGSGYSPIEWARTFLDSFIDASQLIHGLRLRYANWILAGDDVITRLQKMAGFNPNIGVTPGGGVAGTFDYFNTPVVNGQGPAFVGTLQNRFMILHDPVHLTAGTALLGYRGDTMLDTGYIFSPYQALYITPTLVDPNDQTPRRGMMTRFARKLISGNFYATVTITG